MDKEIFEQINKKINEYNTIIIHRHIRPDGDAVGSSLGLREILRDTFPEKEIYCVGKNLPDYLKFVGSQDIIDDDKYKDALVIVVDTATSDRVEDERYKLGKEIIKIDHHFVVESYGAINFVKDDYGACSLLIFELANELNYKITSIAKRYLYIATVTDTGRFKFSGTNNVSLKYASIMLDSDVDIEDIYSNLYVNDRENIKLTSFVYKSIKYTESGVAYLFMTKKIMKKFGVSLEDASSKVNLMEGIRGSLIWIMFIEHDDEIRVRLRSRFVNVREVAENFNGGGHDNAAGASVKNKKEIKKLLAMADEHLKNYKINNEDKF